MKALVSSSKISARSGKLPRHTRRVFRHPACCPSAEKDSPGYYRYGNTRKKRALFP
ncbi:hypothetical protein [Salmonella enterica]|uniref:hypothetical protein n=1 Tax=Salmonella enterica TaxID=28901 RepID=UPI001559F31D|nr:hypothetical protein [Salmonella enterica]